MSDSTPGPSNRPGAATLGGIVVQTIGSIVVAVITAVVTINTKATKAVNEEAGPAVERVLARHDMPLGAVIAYWGDLDALRDTEWVPCDGRSIDDSSPIPDVNSGPGGKQIPDLRGRFIRGLAADQRLLDDRGNIVTGGSDNIASNVHTHKWASFSGRNWTSFAADGTSPATFKGWENGIGNSGTGYYPPAMTGGSREFFTDGDSHDHGRENRPRFTGMHYICRIK